MEKGPKPLTHADLPKNAVLTDSYYVPACEAPTHEPRCDGIGWEVDHFTPWAVGEQLGINRHALDRNENRQNLSSACHHAKDKDTSLRAQMLRLERKGFVPTFEQHRAIFSSDAVTHPWKAEEIANGKRTR